MTTQVGRLVTLLAAMVMTLGLFAAPAMAQPVDQDGLVNVNVSGNTVQLPITAAANVCNVNIAVLADFIGSEDVACEATAESRADRRGGPDNGPITQEGLVNVNVSGNTVQLPIAAAANVCDVNVAVLAEFIGSEEVACEAEAGSRADA